MAETWLRTVFSDSTSLPWTRPDYMGAELGFFNPPGWHDMGWPADRPQPAVGMPRFSHPALDGLPGGDAEPFKTARRIGAGRWRRPDRVA
jgi:hypothetical protein